MFCAVPLIVLSCIQQQRLYARMYVSYMHQSATNIERRATSKFVKYIRLKAL